MPKVARLCIINLQILPEMLILYIYIYIYICMCVYIYIYIYIQALPFEERNRAPSFAFGRKIVHAPGRWNLLKHAKKLNHA